MDQEVRPGTAGEGPDPIELPAPTVWPLVAAFGLSLAASGLVLHIFFTFAGIVVGLIGATGWFRDVFPRERTETVIPAAEERPEPVRAAERRVLRLGAGEERHRMRIPVEVHPYSSGLKGGLVGGIAMAAVALLYGLVAHGSLWYPINLLAGVAMPSMGRADVAQLSTFNWTAFFLALLIHAAGSVLVGLLYAMLLPLLPRRPVLLAGVVAPLLWSGLLSSTLGVVNPALNARIAWGWFIASQLVFGIVTGLVIARSERVATMQTRTFAERAGPEATRERDEDGAGGEGAE